MQEYTRSGGRVYVAIDVAKQKHVALLETPEGRKRSIVIANTRSGIDSFIDAVRPLGNEFEAALEATGDYHRPIAYAMLAAGFKVHFVSSVATNRTREAMYNSWDKNDPKDAFVILTLLKAGNTQIYHDPLINGNHDLQELANAYQQVSMRKTRVYHSILTHYLPLYFPEAERFITNGRSEWFMEVLRATPTPSAVLATSRAAFLRKSLKQGGKITVRRRLLEEFYELAKVSIGLPVAANAPSVEMFRTIVDEFIDLAKRRRAIEDIVENVVGENADYLRLRRIPRHRPDHRADHLGRGW